MATFNPPYGLDYNFNGDNESVPVETYTDKDGKQVTRQEIDDYSAWLEVNPTPVVVVPTE